MGSESSGLGQKQNKAENLSLLRIDLKGWMGATISDPGHFELSWDQTIVSTNNANGNNHNYHDKENDS